MSQSLADAISAILESATPIAGYNPAIVIDRLPTGEVRVRACNLDVAVPGISALPTVSLVRITAKGALLDLAEAVSR